MSATWPSYDSSTTGPHVVAKRGKTSKAFYNSTVSTTVRGCGHTVTETAKGGTPSQAKGSAWTKLKRAVRPHIHGQC